MSVRGEASRNVWLGVLTAVVLAGGVTWILVSKAWEEPPPPTPSRARLDFDPRCEYRIRAPGEEIDVYARPRDDAMIVGEIAHDRQLQVLSKRQSWLELEGPVAGWVRRRYATERCPEAN
ncbi:MAG: hypothetical protein AAF411_03985 [Myxococcota bacterium]